MRAGLAGDLAVVDPAQVVLAVGREQVEVSRQIEPRASTAVHRTRQPFLNGDSIGANGMRVARSINA